jgi:hypothetical protein
VRRRRPARLAFRAGTLTKPVRGREGLRSTAWSTASGFRQLGTGLMECNHAALNRSCREPRTPVSQSTNMSIAYSCSLYHCTDRDSLPGRQRFCRCAGEHVPQRIPGSSASEREQSLRVPSDGYCRSSGRARFEMSPRRCVYGVLVRHLAHRDAEDGPRRPAAAVRNRQSSGRWLGRGLLELALPAAGSNVATPAVDDPHGLTPWVDGQHRSAAQSTVH